MQYEHFCRFTEDSADAEFFGTMAYWLASLYVVAEGWKEMGVPDPFIYDLIAKYDDYYQLLRRFRNGVYHFQPKPLSDKLTAFLNPKSEGHPWTQALLFEFKRFLIVTVPNDAVGEEIKRTIRWWPTDVLVRVKAAGEKNYGELNPNLRFLTRLTRNAYKTRQSDGKPQASPSVCSRCAESYVR